MTKSTTLNHTQFLKNSDPTPLPNVIRFATTTSLLRVMENSSGYASFNGRSPHHKSCQNFTFIHLPPQIEGITKK